MTLPGPVNLATGDLLAAFSRAADSTPPVGWDRPTALYRFFDSDDRVLYVGITHRLKKRTAEHAKEYAGTWWPLVVSRSVEWHRTRTEAGRAERKAILAEQPPFNIQHTPKARVPLASRPSRDYGERGLPLLRLAQQHFDLEPFTAADALGASGRGNATVQMWIKALSDRGLLVRVGTRYCVSKHKGVPIREHALWAIPDSAVARAETFVHQWVDVSSTTRSPSPRTPETKPRRRRKSVTNRANPGGRETALLELAYATFGDRPFTYAELAAADGKEAQSIAKYLRRLRTSGALRDVGRGERTGTRGFAATRYVVAQPSRMILRTAEVAA